MEEMARHCDDDHGFEYLGVLSKYFSSNNNIVTDKNGQCLKMAVFELVKTTYKILN